jgi:uncharacterized protein YndB with AHSA1/START domain
MSASPRPIADNELYIEREFDAPASLVFRLWQDRDHAIRWWGPERFSTTELEMDFRVGGKWRATMMSTSKGVSTMGGEYREIVKDRKIVFTFSWTHQPENPVDSLVTVTFTERNGKTLQTFHQTPFTSVSERDNHVIGWNSFINKEQLYVENVACGLRKGGSI